MRKPRIDGLETRREERLRGRILAIMRRVVDPMSHALDIVYKETANPTGLLADAIPKALEPIFHGFTRIIRELLGPDASDQQVRLCQMSIRPLRQDGAGGQFPFRVKRIFALHFKWPPSCANRFDA
jgi:hypothetical protein